jgi:hypothetical protein
VTRLAGARPGRTVRVKLAVTEAGRLEVRVTDARRRVLSTATLRFAQAGRRTLTLKPKRRGRAATLTLTWTPANGAVETVRRPLRPGA